MKPCVDCRSWAVNPHSHGRDNTRLDLCDVCYWRTKAEEWRRDAERMDWLERVGFSTQNPQTGERTMNVHCYGPVNGRKWTAHYISSQFETARAAIDAARKEGV